MLAQIKAILDSNGRLPVKADTIGSSQDLYAAGLTSFSAVQVMLALEETFDVEFPEKMLNRRSFASIDAIAACIAELRPEALAS